MLELLISSEHPDVYKIRISLHSFIRALISSMLITLTLVTINYIILVLVVIVVAVLYCFIDVSN